MILGVWLSIVDAKVDVFGEFGELDFGLGCGISCHSNARSGLSMS